MRIIEKSLSLVITSIPRGTTGETFKLESKNIPWDLPYSKPYSEEIILNLDVVRTEYEIIVKGTVEGEFLMQCSRCLDPVVVSVDAEVERMYSWDPEMLTDPEVEAVSHNDGTVCILDPVREAIILSVPTVPLCMEQCRGLCPICGINRNREECEHGFED